MYLFIGFYFLAIFVHHLILNVQLFFPIKEKYLNLKHGIYIYILLFIIFFIIYYYFIEINLFCINIEGKNILLENFTVSFYTGFSISWKCLSSIIGAIFSTVGFNYGLLVAKIINGSLIHKLTIGLYLIIFYLFTLLK